MPIQGKISPRMIKNVSTLYNEVDRIFMEFIDNSIDSAEAFFNSDTDSYSRPIDIEINVNGKSYKDGKVYISDNCTGIGKIGKVFESIGNSEKKEQAWTNGQFGYGMYSFLAACKTMKVVSKSKGGDASYIEIPSSIFDVDDMEEFLIPDPESADFSEASGTEICLEDFEKDKWRQIDVEKLIKEIERHFELILCRKNLTVRVVSDQVHICSSFDYSSFEGEIYDDPITEIHYKLRGKNGGMGHPLLKEPIKIFLKVAKDLVLDRPPVFIINGRRLADIKNINAFKSTHKSDIWGHPNITGFIDLGHFLEPTIARNDFRNTNETIALFNGLKEIEPLILDVIGAANKVSNEKHYKVLEDELNKALSALARLDALKYRTEILSQKGMDGIGELEKGGSVEGIEGGAKDKGDEGKGFGGDGWGGEGDGEGLRSGEEDGEDFPSNKKGDNPNVSVPPEGDGFLDEIGSESKKKTGFDIRISSGDPQMRGDTPLRSLFDESSIIIYKEHPDFKDRIYQSRAGEDKISQRLITYLAGEIMVHYMDKRQNKLGQQSMSYDKKMFEELVGYLYQFEDALRHLEGVNLSAMQYE